MAEPRPGTVRCDVATCTWVLYGRSTAYGLRLAGGEGGERFGPPSLQVAFADGTGAVERRPDGYRIDGGHLCAGRADRHCRPPGRGGPPDDDDRRRNRWRST